ncbi:hypothetical protein MKX03_026980, partial [Papaver bracteatum]
RACRRYDSSVIPIRVKPQRKAAVGILSYIQWCLTKTVMLVSMVEQNEALLNGLPVVFEDFYKAPSDVQSILLPLLEGESTFVACPGEEFWPVEFIMKLQTMKILSSRGKPKKKYPSTAT